MPDAYCLKCKRKTTTVRATSHIAKNGTRMRQELYAICRRKKSIIVKKVGGDIQQSLARLPETPWAKYPGEKHLPRYSYCGPGTRLDLRLDEQGRPKQGEEPINRVDGACLNHDIAYKSTDIRARQKADVDLIQDLNEINDPTWGERAGRVAAKAAMKAKILFGGGL